MGKLYRFPRDPSATVLTTWIYGGALYIAQFQGELCPHYHVLRERALACHRSLARSFRRMRAAQ